MPCHCEAGFLGRAEIKSKFLGGAKSNIEQEMRMKGFSVTPGLQIYTGFEGRTAQHK